MASRFINTLARLRGRDRSCLDANMVAGQDFREAAIEVVMAKFKVQKAVGLSRSTCYVKVKRLVSKLASVPVAKLCNLESQFNTEAPLIFRHDITSMFNKLAACV